MRRKFLHREFFQFHIIKPVWRYHWQLSWYSKELGLGLIEVWTEDKQKYSESSLSPGFLGHSNTWLGSELSQHCPRELCFFLNAHIHNIAVFSLLSISISLPELTECKNHEDLLWKPRFSQIQLPAFADAQRILNLQKGKTSKQTNNKTAQLLVLFLTSALTPDFLSQKEIQVESCH